MTKRVSKEDRQAAKEWEANPKAWWVTIRLPRTPEQIARKVMHTEVILYEMIRGESLQEALINDLPALMRLAVQRGKVIPMDAYTSISPVPWASWAIAQRLRDAHKRAAEDKTGSPAA